MIEKDAKDAEVSVSDRGKYLQNDEITSPIKTLQVSNFTILNIYEKIMLSIRVHG